MSKDLTPYEVEEFSVDILKQIEPIENYYENTGKSNAKEADVKITHKKTNNVSYAECKKGNALAGEIQLKPDKLTKQFTYIEKLLPNGNKPSISPLAKEVVKFLNDNNLYNTLMNAGKKRIDIPLNPRICQKCVNHIYKDKNAEIFFIYKKGKYVLFMRNRLNHYLDISVRFRFHPSGSQRHFKTTDFTAYLEDKNYTYKTFVSKYDYKNKKTSKKDLNYVETDADMPDLFEYKHPDHNYSFRFEKCGKNIWIVTMIPPPEKTYPCLEFRCKIKTMVQNPQDMDDVKYFLKHGKRSIRKYKIRK